MTDSSHASNSWPIQDDFVRAARILWESARSHWWLVGALALAGLFIGLIALRLQTPYYVASVDVAPAALNADQGGAASGLGGFASLAGVEINSVDQSVPKFVRFQELLQSAGFAALVASDTDLMETLFGPNWDHSRGTWEPGVLKPTLKQRIKSLLTGFPLSSAPGAVEIAAHLKKVVSIRPRRDKIVRISFKHRDPIQAAAFLDRLTLLADEVLRKEAQVQSETYIEYMRKRLETVSNSDHRAAMINVMSEFEREALLSGASGVAFAAMVIDPPSAPIAPSGPNPILYIGASIIGMASLGLLIAVILTQNPTLLAISQRTTKIELPKLRRVASWF